MMPSVSHILHAFLKKHNCSWQMYLIQNWRTIVGNLHTHMCLEKIQDHSVIVGVYDPHWMQELFLLHDMLIETINAHFDKPQVKHIRLKLAKKASQKPVKKPVKRTIIQSGLVVTSRHQHALDAVKDRELKELLYKFLQHCHSA